MKTKIYNFTKCNLKTAVQYIFSIILLILYTTSGHSQGNPRSESISLDTQLRGIDLTTVTSGIIYERTAQIANLYNFNKTEKFNTANYPYFRQALLELHKASNGKKFISVDNLENLVAPTVDKNVVDLAILSTEFQVLNYNQDAPLSGGLTFNSDSYEFEQIKGQKPFYKMYNTIISPTKESVSGTEIVYRLRSDLFFQNGDKSIKTLIANFGDGVQRTIISNFEFISQEIVVNYKTTGLKTNMFELTFNDDSKLITYGKIFFMYKIKTNETTESSCAGADLFKEDWLINADESFNNYDGTSGFKAKIEARIFYHNGSNPAPSRKLLRPIIVIDGFDPGDKRKIEDCDCADDPACVVKNLKDNIFEPKLHDSFYDLMDYKNNIGENKNLVNTLRSEGYDVILVNQPNYIHPTKPTVPAEGLAGLLGYTKPNIVDGGADYIERNALALVSLIKKVNSKLLGNGSKSQIAIFGPSMGGQISKYALAYMEKKYVETNNNDWQHNTYLWVSVDSPHLGANIPIGVQSLLNLAKDSSDGAKEFYEKNLRTPAAQQQLIELHREKPVINVFGTNYDYNNADPNYLNSQTISQNLPTNQGSSFFQQHYNNQNSNGVANSHGWPINLRKIALTNGSLTGSKETVLASGARGPNFANDGEKILNIRGFQRFNYDICWDPLCYFQSHITFRIHIASLESHFMPSPGNNARVSRFKKLFDDRTTNAFNNNSRGVMDNVPGGYFKSQSLVVDETLATDPVPGTDLSTIGNWSFSNISFGNIIKTISEQLGGSEWYLHEFNPNHSFIPTFSSLAILNPNQSWNNPLNTNLTCETDRQTPFDSYYGEAKNSEHTSFNYNSVKWLLLELEKNHQAPNFPIDQNALVGSKIICLNTNETTSFLDICKVPSAATWSVSDGLEIVSFTDYSVTVKLIPNQPTIITATFQNGQTLKKDIWAGPPSPPTIVNKSCYGGNDAPCYISNYPHDSYGIGAYGLSLEAYGLETNTNPNDWQWVSESANCGFSGFGLTINEAVSQRNGRETYIKFIMMNQQIPAEIKFKCRVKNICGWSEWRHFVFTFSDGVAEPVVVVPTYIKYFNISPNPGTSYTQINLIDPNVAPPSGAVVTAKLYSIFNPSAILYTIQLTNNTGYFYLSNLPSGYYAVDITFGNNSEGYTLIKN